MPGTSDRIGFIGLEPGVTRGHVWVLLYAAFVTIGLATLDAFATPYVPSTSVGIPIGEQGAVVGRLNVYTESVLLMVFAPFVLLGLMNLAVLATARTPPRPPRPDGAPAAVAGAVPR